MVLAAIYNVWDGDELLPYSIKSIEDHVDLIILVYQDVSNYGEQYGPDVISQKGSVFLTAIHFRPNFSLTPAANEIRKRMLGIQKAESMGATHFLHMDCDEMYVDFGKAKNEYLESGADGSVCRILTYFKAPTLRLRTFDNYFVPFIHELKSDTIAGNRDYPFYVDPTRRINTGSVVQISEPMHHFSWVRKDIERKVRNSTARKNIERSKLLRDYYHPDLKAGYYLEDYRQELIEVENIFNINIE